MEFLLAYKKAEEMCKNHNAYLLYFVYGGSTLYGTRTPSSDFDFKGIFLPSKEDAYNGTMPEVLQFSTGDSETKNTNEDYEIELFSIQKFLHKLVATGQTVALDMLYGYNFGKYNASLYNLFKNPQKCYNKRNLSAFVGYAIGQSVKFSIKGERVAIAEKMKDKCEKIIRNNPQWAAFIDSIRIHDIIDKFEPIFDGNFCKIEESEGPNKEMQKFLFVLGKKYMFTMPLVEFHKKMEERVAEYGKRAQAAKNAEGVDWKCTSHACRVLFEVEELLDYDTITFPLKEAEFLRNVKLGKIDIEEVRNLLSSKLEEVEKKMQNIKKDTYDNKFTRDIINLLYTF